MQIEKCLDLLIELTTKVLQVMLVVRKGVHRRNDMRAGKPCPDCCSALESEIRME